MEFDDLYYGIKYFNPNTKELTTINIFNSSRIKEACSLYLLMDEEEKGAIQEPLFFCFSSLWGRVEWEFEIGTIFGEKTQKVDVYTMYIEPNREILMNMVKSVSKKEAEFVIKEWRKRYTNELRKSDQRRLKRQAHD